MLESTSSCSAVSFPSLSAPALTVTRIGCRVEVEMNCSSRVSSNLTGRPVLSAASARMSSTNISCLPPNPPPTRSQNTRTLSGGRSNRSASVRRVRNGTWVLDRTLRIPSVIEPGKPAMGFQRGMLDPLAGEGALIGYSRSCERRRDVAELSVGFRDDIARRIGHAMLWRLVGMNSGRTWKLSPAQGQSPPAGSRTRP